MSRLASRVRRQVHVAMVRQSRLCGRDAWYLLSGWISLVLDVAHELVRLEESEMNARVVKHVYRQTNHGRDNPTAPTPWIVAVSDAVAKIEDDHHFAKPVESTPCFRGIMGEH
jgi:hypothetical protein